MARRHTTDRDLGLRRFIRELQSARRVEVVVGIQQGDLNEDGDLIAEYAAHNEFGTENIPERSFMRSSFDENVQNLKSYMDSQYKMVVSGEKTVRRALGAVGEKHQQQIMLKIGSNIQPPNSPVTIAKKKSSKTLIDTAAMKNSVRYMVRKSR